MDDSPRTFKWIDGTERSSLSNFFLSFPLSSHIPLFCFAPFPFSFTCSFNPHLSGVYCTNLEELKSWLLLQESKTSLSHLLLLHAKDLSTLFLKYMLFSARQNHSQMVGMIQVWHVPHPYIISSHVSQVLDRITLQWISCLPAKRNRWKTE